MFLGCLAGAAANLAVLATDSPAAVIALRALTGAALACVYPPALKIAAGWFLRGRGLALGILVGALTLGTAFPYLLTALFGDDWRTTMRLASALAVAGGLLSLTVLRDGPHVSPRAPFNPRAVRDVLRIRHARLATAAYLGHMWELYAMWAWVGVLATASLEAAGAAQPARGGAIAAFVAIGSGLAGCLVAGWLADRFGRARVAGWALATSGLCAAAVSLVFGGPPVWLYALLALWGFAVVADSAQFSALVSDAVSRDHVGTALTLQTCLGFLLTLLTIDLLPRMAGIVGWQHASWLLVPGPVAGLIALRRLR
jgi:MFS family permease